MSFLPVGGGIGAMLGGGVDPLQALSFGASQGIYSNPQMTQQPGMSVPGSLGEQMSAALAQNNKLGFNTGTANLALSGLQTIGNLFAAFQANKLAKQQFKYTKKVTDANLGNQIQSYNTALSDRINSRYVMEGKSPDQAQSYLDVNKLKSFGG